MPKDMSNTENYPVLNKLANTTELIWQYDSVESTDVSKKTVIKNYIFISIPLILIGLAIYYFLDALVIGILFSAITITLALSLHFFMDVMKSAQHIYAFDRKNLYFIVKTFFKEEIYTLPISEIKNVKLEAYPKSPIGTIHFITDFDLGYKFSDLNIDIASPRKYPCFQYIEKADIVAQKIQTLKNSIK